MTRGTALAADALALLHGALLALLSIRVIAYRENHVGWDPLWGLASCALWGVMSLAARRRTGRARFTWMLGGACAFALALVLLVRWNVLVAYEDWLRRGMPARPF